jgi:hypothetical protein
MSAPAPDIWSAAQFKQETNPKSVRKALAGIDTQLQRWDANKGGPSTTVRIEILRAISQCCIAYLEVKEGKKAKQDNARFGKPSARLINRIDKVKRLAQQVFLRLAFERYKYQKVVRTQGGRGMPARVGTQLAGLKGSYAHERTNFDNIKQNQALAGTQTPIDPQGASYVHQRITEHEAGNPGAGAAPPALVALLNKGFDNLTLNDFNTIQAHFAQGAQGLGALPNVHYARKDERLRDLMLVPEDGLLYTAQGKLCDIGWSAYAVDRYGNLLIARANRTWTHGLTNAQFNHSTLAAGGPVICAGEIKIKNGLIEYISNESGHYRPSAEQLANAIYTLAEEYTLPLVRSIQDVVELTAAGKVSHKGVLSFLAAHPNLVG